MTAGRSQVQAINEPPPKTWDDYETGCVATYRGGHHDPAEARAFVHGMRTVFSLLRHEFPPAEDCKNNAAAIEAAKAVVQWFDAENQNLGTFHDKMDLCKYAEWAARKALGQAVGEFQGVPRLVLVFKQQEE